MISENLISNKPCEEERKKGHLLYKFSGLWENVLTLWQYLFL